VASEGLTSELAQGLLISSPETAIMTDQTDGPKDRYIPNVFRLIIREGQRERSPEEQEAARRFVLGRGTFAECVTARRQVMER
jgi:hypothetical protein